MCRFLMCAVLTGFTFSSFYDDTTGENTGDLKFWVRDPQIDFRRMPDGEKNVIGKNKDKSQSHVRKADVTKLPILSDPLFKQHMRSGGQTTLRQVTKMNPGEYVEKFVDSDDELSYLDPYSLRRQLEKIIPKFSNANITLNVLGRTVEYKDIVLLKITDRKGKKRFRASDETKYADDEMEKKIIFIVHGLSIMAFRDIPALADVSNFAQLLSYYMSHLDKFDIYLIPMANPDGMTYYKGFWNKNMSPQKACPGVALDRNFDIAWNSSQLISSCSQLYPGPSPFSEIESQVIRDIFHFYHHKIIAYIHVHGGSYNQKSFKGEAVLYPKGYTDIREDDDLYLDLRGEIEEGLRNASFKVMSVTVDTLQSWYGIVSGSSVDYAATVYNVPFAFEFVMQPYETSFNFDVFEEEIAFDSLNALWSRIIDVVFNFMWKSTQQTENRL